MKEKRDIEWLVNWALEGQGLARIAAGVASADWTVLGTRVDGGRIDYSGRAVVDGAPHHDAVIIASAISGLPQEAAGLVTRFGRLGYGDFARPDWCPEGEGEWIVDRKPNGEPRWEYEDMLQRKGKKRPRMVFVGHQPDWVEWCHAEYALWWTALVELVPIVNLAMKSHEAQPPRALERPWEAPAPVIHMAS